MKVLTKFTTALSVLILLLVSLLAVNINYSYAAGGYTVTKNGKVFYEAAGERAAACDNMNEMAEAEWSISKPITYKYKSGGEFTLLPGKHKGIPYTQYNRLYPDISELQRNMDLTLTPTVITVTDPETGEETTTEIYENPVMGLDCSSAITYALRKALGRNGDYDSFLIGGNLVYKTHQYLFDGMNGGYGSATSIKGVRFSYRDDLTKIGYYGNYNRYTYANETDSILAGLTAQGNYKHGTVYENIYAKMRPGDVLVKVNTSGLGHVMLVTGVNIVYNSDGTVNPKKSRVIFTDQSSPGKSSFPGNVQSSWRNSKTYNPTTGKVNNSWTFNYLANSGKFLPVSIWHDNTSYTVKFNLNGGSGSFYSLTKMSYMPVEIPGSEPVRMGYTFNGWQSTTNPAKVKYSAGSAYFEEADDVLKATWTLNRGRVNYDANGGSGAPSYQTQYYGKPLTVTSTKPSRQGYKFLGWSLSPDAETPEVSAGSEYKDDARLENKSDVPVTFYAVWQKSVKGAEIELSETERYYNGEEFRPVISLSFEGNQLTEGTDYILTLPEKSVKAGTYTVKIKGMGEYAESTSVNYKIKKYEQKVDSVNSFDTKYKKKSFSLSASSETKLSYKSSNTSVATVSAGGVASINGVGKADITITAKETDYYSKAVKVVTIRVYPQKTHITGTKLGKKKLTVSWKRINEECSGYQIRYSRSADMSNAVKIKINGNSQRYIKLKRHAKKHKYHIQVRTYKKTPGKTYYSAWSDIKIAKF